MTTKDPVRTPMMQQWHACKERAHGALLLFRMGDFYEAFEEDAQQLAALLGIVLTKRQSTPMAGIPVQALDTTLDKLLRSNVKVAIAEQMSTPGEQKGLVERQVVHIATPGTYTHNASERRSHYIAAISQVGQDYGLAYMDVATGELACSTTAQWAILESMLQRLHPREVLYHTQLQHSKALQKSAQCHGWCLSGVAAWYYAPQQAAEIVHTYCQASVEEAELAQHFPILTAIGALLRYLREELLLDLRGVEKVHYLAQELYLDIDAATAAAINLHTEDGQISLADLLDEAITPMGSRCIRQWTRLPSRDRATIEERLNGVAALVQTPSVLKELRDALLPIKDLHRLARLAAQKRLLPHHLWALVTSIQGMVQLQQLLQDHVTALPMLTQWQDLTPLCTLITEHLDEDPSTKVGEGGVLRVGVDPQLDKLRQQQQEGKRWLLTYQEELRSATGIKNLKVGYTPAFGYFLEVSKGNVTKVPQTWKRGQTLVNAQRYTCQELSLYQAQTVRLTHAIEAREKELYDALLTQLCPYATPLAAMAQLIATLDALATFAHLSRAHNYTRPTIDPHDHYQFEQGRHPLVERCVEHFTPNSLIFDYQHQLYILTGPNMGGKSTFIRQAALLAVMAHIGCFVPAKSMRIGILDGIYARVGAHDNLTQGDSTFMVEMRETARILQRATRHSLVILDEIGRGTSAHEGLAIAHAVAVSLLTDRVQRPKTLLATHYHELSTLPDTYQEAHNMHVEVEQTPQGPIFLHKVSRGMASHSYALVVAQQAGMPAATLQHAQAFLQGKKKGPTKRKKEPAQLNFLQQTDPPCPIKKQLKALDLDAIAPRQALELLYQLKGMLRL